MFIKIGRKCRTYYSKSAIVRVLLGDKYDGYPIKKPKRRGHIVVRCCLDKTSASTFLYSPSSRYDENDLKEFVERLDQSKSGDTVDWPKRKLKHPERSNFNVLVRDLEQEVRNEMVGECPFAT